MVSNTRHLISRRRNFRNDYIRICVSADTTNRAGPITVGLECQPFARGSVGVNRSGGGGFCCGFGRLFRGGLGFHGGGFCTLIGGIMDGYVEGIQIIRAVVVRKCLRDEFSNGLGGRGIIHLNNHIDRKRIGSIIRYGQNTLAHGTVGNLISLGIKEQILHVIVVFFAGEIQCHGVCALHFQQIEALDLQQGGG